MRGESFCEALLTVVVVEVKQKMRNTCTHIHLHAHYHHRPFEFHHKSTSVHACTLTGLTKKKLKKQRRREKVARRHGDLADEIQSESDVGVHCGGLDLHAARKLQQRIDAGDFASTSLDLTNLRGNPNRKPHPSWNSSSCGSTPAVGIDFGGVLCGHSTPTAAQPSHQAGAAEQAEDTTMFGQNYLRSPMIPGARQGVAVLVEKYGASRVFIVSKAGEAMRQKALHWYSCTLL